MNLLNLLSRWSILGAIGALVVLSAPHRAGAQDTTTTTMKHGNPALETSVRNAEVAYVEGNDLVLKLESGRIEHIVVPESDVFTVDGKNLSVHDLQPGTRLTQTITTTTTPRYVNTVRTIKGKIWHVNAPQTVIVSLPDGTNQIYRIPSHAKFMVDGKEKSLPNLRKGMNFEATIVTDDTHTIVSRNKANIGQAPPPQLPRLVGVLLFPQLPQTLQPDPTPIGSVTAEHAWARVTLPQTGSELPLIGLFGLLSLAIAGAFWTVARRN